MSKPRTRFASIRGGLFTLLLCTAGAAMVLPAVAACGPSGKTATGQAPAQDAEMKEVVINVFGMT